MAYADYSYYETGYLLWRSPVVSAEDFPFFEKQADELAYSIMMFIMDMR